jgi:hypothetical protein
MNHNPESRIHILWCQIYSEWDYPHAKVKFISRQREEPKSSWRWEQWGDPFSILRSETDTIRKVLEVEAFPLQRTQVRGQKLESMLRKLLKHIRRENGRITRMPSHAANESPSPQSVAAPSDVSASNQEPTQTPKTRHSGPSNPEAS